MLAFYSLVGIAYNAKTCYMQSHPVMRENVNEKPLVPMYSAPKSVMPQKVKPLKSRNISSFKGCLEAMNECFDSFKVKPEEIPPPYSFSPSAPPIPLS